MAFAESEGTVDSLGQFFQESDQYLGTDSARSRKMGARPLAFTDRIVLVIGSANIKFWRVDQLVT